MKNLASLAGFHAKKCNNPGIRRKNVDKTLSFIIDMIQLTRQTRACVCVCVCVCVCACVWIHATYDIHATLLYAHETA